MHPSDLFGYLILAPLTLAYALVPMLVFGFILWLMFEPIISAVNESVERRRAKKTQRDIEELTRNVLELQQTALQMSLTRLTAPPQPRYSLPARVSAPRYDDIIEGEFVEIFQSSNPAAELARLRPDQLARLRHQLSSMRKHGTDHDYP